MQCTVCRLIGRMKKCGKCGSVWCESCATQGKGHYPKQTAANRCPYCGTVG